jgi:RimJ/RimL family protein N-acetyltransferase
MARIVAQTDRLRLRTWDEADEKRFYEIMNNLPVMRWLGGLQTPEEWHKGYERLRQYERDLGFTFWIVDRRADEEILGFCGLKRANAPGADAIAGEVEIGWRLREEAWGQGYAKEAAIASLDLAFDRFNAPRVVAVTAAKNAPSQGLMNRLGMTRREELDFIDRRFAPDSDVNPQVVFAVEAEGWPAARASALF